MSWTETRNRLRKRWKVEREEETWSGVVVEFDDGRQRVVVKPTEGLARERVIVAAQVCALGDAEPTTALRYNSIAVRGALALEQGAYILRDLVSHDDVEAAVEELAREAHRLRIATAQARWNDAVTHYAD
jgi:hypothetical protein